MKNKKMALLNPWQPGTIQNTNKCAQLFTLHFRKNMSIKNTAKSKEKKKK